MKVTRRGTGSGARSERDVVRRGRSDEGEQAHPFIGHRALVRFADALELADGQDHLAPRTSDAPRAGSAAHVEKTPSQGGFLKSRNRKSMKGTKDMKKGNC